MILPLDNPQGCTESQCRTEWLILSPRIVRPDAEIISIYEPRKYREDKPGICRKDGEKDCDSAMLRAMAVARLREV
jgi:hypothetical protein